MRSINSLGYADLIYMESTEKSKICKSFSPLPEMPFLLLTDMNNGLLLRTFPMEKYIKMG